MKKVGKTIMCIIYQRDMMKRSSNKTSFWAISAKNELVLLLLCVISLWCTYIPTYLLNIFVATLDEKRFIEILTSLQYKLLYNINRSEKWGKKIQTAGYNGAHTIGEKVFI